MQIKESNGFSPFVLSAAFLGNHRYHVCLRQLIQNVNGDFMRKEANQPPLESNNFCTSLQREQLSEIIFCRTRTRGFVSGCFVKQLCTSARGRPGFDSHHIQRCGRRRMTIDTHVVQWLKRCRKMVICKHIIEVTYKPMV